MTDKPKLHLIQGTLAPDTPAEKVRKRVRAMPKPPTMVQCHRCGGREVIETRIGVLMKNGKPSGGTKAMICVGCLLQGERVLV
ncbi:hypothetical protein [Pseudomonas fragi]|uniref:hypothetical protein n=1 Tax=Pseudomonas fragi TaxID=296 RepID=UPI001476503C|nr:hypothetical protein [Pseudomonas fragi]NNB54218.1 hypothetical protein [Pseudomonas fragi]